MLIAARSSQDFACCAQLVGKPGAAYGRTRERGKMWRLRGFRNWELLFQQYAYADFQRTLRGTVPPKDATPMAPKRDPSQNLMSTIHYFAYGSNMSTPRLRYRVPGCRFEFVARLPNYKLCFHKRSNDGSVKCNAFKTAEPTDAVIGVVYENPNERKART
jgi:hypothetical protein